MQLPNKLPCHPSETNRIIFRYLYTRQASTELVFYNGIFPHRNPEVSCLIHFTGENIEAPKQEATPTKWQRQGKNWAALFQILALSSGH